MATAGTSYYRGNTMGGTVTSTGTITIRNAGRSAVTITNYTTNSFTYIVAK